MKKYLEWVKNNWQKAAVLVLIYILVSLVPIYFKVELIEFMLLLAFPLYLVHEIEEYILPGGFPKFFNENLLKVNHHNKITPIDREVIFWINLVYIWMVIPLFSALGFINLQFAAWIPYFLIFQGLSHLGMGIVGKQLINPGIRSSFFLHIPYSIIMINLLVSNGVFLNPYFNVYMLVGFVFNGSLAVFAKLVVMPRYYKLLKNS